VLVLIGVGFLAGLITALSPCVLPVLPLVLAGGASGGRRRPYAIVAGLVASFTVFTLAASALLDALGLPQDFLRNLAIALLFVVAATLVSTRFAHLLERPFYFLTRRRVGDAGGGFVLGLSLGLVFVPCAGPVLAAVSVLAANREVGGETVALTLAYAVGAAVPLLAIAVGGRRVSAPLRARTPWLRPLLGGVVAVVALAIALGADRPFQTAVPGYTEAFQERVERSSAAERSWGS
jgi:cytochrome c biogenesis protein CcdA